MCPGNLEVVRKPQLSLPVAVVLFLTIIAGGPVRLRWRVRMRRLRNMRLRSMNLLLGVVWRLRMGHGVLSVLVYFTLRRSWLLLFRHFLFAFRRFFVSSLLLRYVFSINCPLLLALYLGFLDLSVLFLGLPLFCSGVISRLFNERLQLAVSSWLNFRGSAWRWRFCLWRLSLCECLDLRLVR
jgi:hypothetical protein